MDRQFGTRVSFLGLNFLSLSPALLAHALVERMIAGCQTTVSFMNPHSVNLYFADTVFATWLKALDLVGADGQGVVWMSKLFASPISHRLSADILLPPLFSLFQKKCLSVFFFGAGPGVAQQAARRIREHYPTLKVAGSHHGYVSGDQEASVVRMVNASEADALFVGLGAPLQERFIYYHRGDCDARLLMTCGGYFDQAAQSGIHYYPDWIHRRKLNWAYRLYREPRRLWYRYLVGIPQFLVNVVRWRCEQ